jgi:hypothetical protein
MQGSWGLGCGIGSQGREIYCFGLRVKGCDPKYIAVFFSYNVGLRICCLKNNV